MQIIRRGLEKDHGEAVLVNDKLSEASVRWEPWSGVASEVGNSHILSVRVKGVITERSNHVYHIRIGVKEFEHIFRKMPTAVIASCMKAMPQTDQAPELVGEVMKQTFALLIARSGGTKPEEERRVAGVTSSLPSDV